MKQLFAQLALVWRELGLNQKVSVAITAIFVIGGLVALAMWANRPQMKLLYGGLDDKEAGAILTALQDAGVPYEIGPGGRSIFVPANQVYKTRMELAAKGLPSGGGVGFEIFDRTNFGISDFVQRTNYLRALQGELARTITGLQGVREARVMVVIPENRLILRGDQIRPTASVFVDTGGNRLETPQVNAIRSLVAAAVQGLQPSDVSVVDNHGNSLSEELNTDPMLSTASSQMKFRKQIEDYLTQKVESMLAQVVGPGNAVVRVAAEIDNEMAVISEEKFDPEGQVPRTENVMEDVSNSVESGGNQQPVGVVANIPAPNQQAGAGAPPTRTVNTSRTSRTTNFEINRTITNLTRAPGSISRLTAAVFVSPKSPEQPNAQPAPRTPEEIAALRQVVAHALGITTRTPEEMERLISIVETPIQPVVTAGLPQPTGIKGLDQLWPAVALAAALIIFIAFFLALRKTKPEQITFELIEDEPAPPPPPALLPNRKDHKISPELLNELIQQKPENVGVTIRQWLAQRGPQ